MAAQAGSNQAIPRCDDPAVQLTLSQFTNLKPIQGIDYESLAVQFATQIRKKKFWTHLWSLVAALVIGPLLVFVGWGLSLFLDSAGWQFPISNSMMAVIGIAVIIALLAFYCFVTRRKIENADLAMRAEAAVHVIYVESIECVSIAGGDSGMTTDYPFARTNLGVIPLEEQTKKMKAGHFYCIFGARPQRILYTSEVKLMRSDFIPLWSWYHELVKMANKNQVT